MQSAFTIRSGLTPCLDSVIVANAAVALFRRATVSLAALAEIATIIVERKKQTFLILVSFTVACRAACVVAKENE